MAIGTMTSGTRGVLLVAVVGITVAAPVAPPIAAPVAAQVRVDNGRHTRLQRFARDMAYGTAEALAFAGWDQINESPPEWGTGFTGYKKRAASNIGEFVIQESVTEGLAPILKRPLDYTRCKCTETGRRIGHALAGAVRDELQDGTYKFAIPRVTGAYAGAFAQASWRPDVGRDRLGVALRNGTTSLALGAMINLFHEFVK